MKVNKWSIKVCGGKGPQEMQGGVEGGTRVCMKHSDSRTDDRGDESRERRARRKGHEEKMWFLVGEGSDGGMGSGREEVGWWWVITQLSALVGRVAVGVAVWHICAYTHIHTHTAGCYASTCLQLWRWFEDNAGTPRGHRVHTLVHAHPFLLKHARNDDGWVRGLIKTEGDVQGQREHRPTSLLYSFLPHSYFIRWFVCAGSCCEQDDIKTKPKKTNRMTLTQNKKNEQDDIKTNKKKKHFSHDIIWCVPHPKHMMCAPS